MPITSLQFKGLNYRRFSDPFSLNEIFQSDLSDAMNPKKACGHYLPLIEDYSDVSLISLDTSDITEHLNKIRNSNEILKPFLDNYVACVARDLGSFGMLRMYGIYAEIYDIRKEEKFYVADSLLEAATWLMFKTGHCSNEAFEAADFFAGAA